MKVDKLVNINGRHLMQAVDTRHVLDGGCVDQRTQGGICCDTDFEDPIKAFRMAHQTDFAGCWKWTWCSFTIFMRSALKRHNRLFRFSRIGPGRLSQ
jgi:hypothetical protein